jgi:hypothetical protein
VRGRKERRGRLAEKRDDLTVLGETADLLLRVDQAAVGEHVELRLRARRDLRLDVERLGELGRETRGP